MKLTTKLALSQLKVNRRRTIWTIMGILLTTAMLTVIYGLGFGSGMDWVERMLLDASHNDRVIFLSMISGLAFVMSVIVICIAVIVVSNAFRVSANERLTQFGILKSTGATKKQIAKTVIAEGNFLMMIGLPIGIVIGLIVHLVGIEVINRFLEPLLSYEDLQNDAFFQFVFYPRALILATLVSMLTIFISAWLPARKAAKIPAIDAIRGIGEVKVKNKKIRGKGLTQKAFGYEGLLARTFLKRSSRNFRATVIVMSFSIAIFIIAGSFFDHMNSFSGMRWGGATFGNVSASIWIDTERGIQVEFEDIDQEVDVWWTEQIVDGDGNVIETHYFIQENTEIMLQRDDFDTLTNRIGNLLEDGDTMIAQVSNDRFETEIPVNDITDFTAYHRARWDWGIENDLAWFHVNLIVLDEASAQKFAEMAGVPVGSNILLNHGQEWHDDGRVATGAILDFGPFTIEIKTDEDTYEFDIHGQISDEDAFHYFGWSGTSSLNIIVSEVSADMAFQSLRWLIDTREPEQVTSLLQEELDAYLSDIASWMNVINHEELAALERNTTQLVTTLTFAFVGTLILISLTNVISTISENVKTRSKEFAALQSVGMTGGGIKRMLSLEAIFSSMKSLIFGVPLGLLGSFAVFNAINNAAEFDFSWPWLWILAAIVAVFLITYATMNHAANSLKKQNIIETIRNGSGM
ncbi:MAG: ABC transporter permease [Defluviitaleaceae bacterium]|nr:ABC transporter permease [Defluviitaleaceae bacterium]